VQIALVIAKAARFDFPQQWPSLFNDLMAGLSNGSTAQAAGQQPQQQTLLVRRTYFVLHHVLKELSSKRLAADQKAFVQVGVWAHAIGQLQLLHSYFTFLFQPVYPPSYALWYMLMLPTVGYSYIFAAHSVQWGSGHRLLCL